MMHGAFRNERLHLHVHLEPEARTLRASGGSYRSPTTAFEFFTSHSTENASRIHPSLRQLSGFIHQFHLEQRAEGVGYAELRISPRRFMRGSGLYDVLSFVSTCLQDLKFPTLRAVLLLNRDSSHELIQLAADVISSSELSAFVGIDIAGDELAFPDLSKFVRLAETARSRGMGIAVHAGEFGGARSIWTAIDVVGAERIGHGLSCTNDLALLDRLSRDGVALEICPSSNLALQAIPSFEALSNLRLASEYNIPLTANVDLPLLTKSNLDYEESVVQRILGEDYDLLNAARRAAFSTAWSR